MVLKETFAEAQSRVRRILEAAGGSADAYEDVPAPAVPLDRKPTWDEVCQMGKPVQATKPAPQAEPEEGYSVPASEEPTNEEIDAMIRESLTEPTPPAKPAVDTELDCAVGFEEIFGIGQAPAPVGPEYALAGHTTDMGELEHIYMAFALNKVSGECEEVQLESGVQHLTKFGPSWQLIDKQKGLRYLLDDISVHHPEVQPEDTFIWVLPLNKQGGDDFGYIHRGWCFMRK